MSGAALVYRIEAGSAHEFFAWVKGRLTDMTPVMRVAGEILRTSAVRNFEEGGRPDKWEPHAMATVLGGIRKKDFTKRGKLRGGAGRRLRRGRVLVRSGRLMGSISWQATRESATVGTNVVYAAIHQFGGEAGRKGHRVTIPARPFLLVQDEDHAEIRRSAIEHILHGGKA